MNEGHTLDTNVKRHVIRIVIYHMIVFILIFVIIMAVSIIPAIHTAVRDNSYFFLIAVIIFAFILVIITYIDGQRIKALNSNSFNWCYEQVEKVVYLGSKFSRPHLCTTNFSATTQQPIFMFKNGQNVLILRYLPTTKISFIYNPIAYKVKSDSTYHFK